MRNAQLSLRTQVATMAGLAATGLSRRFGLGEGSVIGGRVSLAIDPNMLQCLSEGRTVALVSGTNGKTTTTSLLVAAMKTAGPVVTNSTGSNMFGGMVAALSQSDARTVVLEVDEGHLPSTLESTKAGFVVLLNMTRDQLDRVGEVRMQAQRWKAALSDSNAVVVANADDPLVTWAALSAKSVVWVAGGASWKLDASSCPECGCRIVWEHDQNWSCSGCVMKRPNPHAFLGTAAPGASGDAIVPMEMKLPGEINRRNGAVAITAAVMMGADPVKAGDAVANTGGAGGRFSNTEINGTRVRLSLAKNPAGWSEALRIVEGNSFPVVVAINARVQDGRDPSWLWDVPFEQLSGRFVVATGDRGRDLAVRLKYANVDHVFVSDRAHAVHIAAERATGERIDVMGNYSAFQDFRKLSIGDTGE